MIARCKCGCRGIMLAIAGELSAADRARIGEVACKGYHVEKMTVGVAREEPWGCRNRSLANPTIAKEPVDGTGGRDG